MNGWLKKGLIAGAGVVGAALLATGLVSVRLGGDHAQAASGTGTPPAASQTLVKPSLVAVAIGQLKEPTGESFTVDLHAAIRSGTPGGALRFFGGEVGYYNGGVKTLSTDGGVIKVTGGGGLFRLDGTRIGVRYAAEFAEDGSHAKITVDGRNYHYVMEGTFDGLVHVYTP